MSEFPTVGVEEEFLLVDPRSGEPAPHNAAVAAEAERRGITLQLELSGCQVETTSSVAATSAELGEERLPKRSQGLGVAAQVPAAARRPRPRRRQVRDVPGRLRLVHR